MSTHPTRDEALSEASKAFGVAFDLRDSLSPREAAERAHRAGGPSVDEIEQMIRAQRYGVAS